ncbi:probable E3 ubiquitin-protein ligase bre1 [Drosophila yakuba]|uniref:Uncharacterized protein n=1 Tax=Drosophila yakuba TaxID=7245 RepID=B4P275_DROYA|nr:probable E3 ubiquitin-protein ligase bre1 [Drosophila yakuba]EDW89276.1 uncharacterized protein Dyak_GE23388 [Drosophila yakuba]
MSHLLRRTRKSCLKFLRKISTSKQLFVQRLDEEDGDDEDVEEELNLQRDLELDVNSNCPVTEAIYEELQLSECNQALDLAKEEEEELQPAAKHDLRFKYLMSCGNYEVLATPPTTIEFERVKYKANVRYLRHTPSNSSLDLQLEEQKEEQKAEQKEEQPAQQQATPRKQQVQQQATPRKQQVQQRIPTPSRYHPCSISLGSKLEGNYHSVVIMEPPHDDFPIVKWDINGNSLDDDTCDRWDDFDARWRQAAVATRSLSQSQKSSHQSSSCTLETWVDDTEPLSLELHRHDNAVAGNNCNLCLRSF